MRHALVFLSFILFVVAIPTVAYGQSDSANWPLTSVTTTSVTTNGNVTATAEGFSNMVINSYGGQVGPLGVASQRVEISGGSWTAETVPDFNRYVEFTVSPATGYSLAVDSILIPIGAAGGGNMRADIWYSTDGFSSSTQLADSLVLPSGGWLYENYGPSLTVDDGSTLSIRIFPWYTSTSTGKRVVLQDITIKGTATSTFALAEWKLTSVTTTNDTTIGNVTATDEGFSNMVVNSYGGMTGPLGVASQRVEITGGSWTASTDPDFNRYVEFTVTPATGYSLAVDSILVPIAAAGGGNMRADIWYSTDGFSSSTQLADALVLSTSSWLYEAYAPTLSVNDGSTLSIRVFPWYTSTSTGKRVLLQDIRILGTTSTFVASAPTVTTASISNITKVSADGGGNVTDDGGNAVTAKGVCWNTSGTPTTGDNLTVDGSGTGAYSSSLTGLDPGITYYVRAYATNGVGTSYGGEVSFSTLSSGIFSGTPSSIDFGSVVVSGSKDDSVFVTNIGTIDLHIDSVNSDNSDFSAAPGTATIGASSIDTFTVTFSPSAPGATNGNIVFYHDGPSSPDTVTVAGNGLTAAALFSVDPTSLNFGKVAVGNSKSDSVKVTNGGAATLSISGVAADNGVYSVDPTSASITGGDSAWFVVTFTPSGSGVVNANVVFTHNATSSPDTVTVTGDTPVLILSNGTGGGDWANSSTWQGSVVPDPDDSVRILSGDSVWVAVGAACRFLETEAGSMMGIDEGLNAGFFLGYGSMVVHTNGEFNIDSSGSFGNGATYEHARNSGGLPVATWNTGSTIIFTGVTSSMPSDRVQDFYNLIWNCPSQSSNLNMGWTGVTIGGDITCLSSGTGRFQLSSSSQNPATITIMGDINVSDGTLASNGSGTAATYDIYVHGDINVTGGNLSLSRGSGGEARWYLYGNFSVADATLQTSNHDSKYIFSKSGTQTITLSNVTYTSDNDLEVAAGSTADFGTSILGGGGTFALDADAMMATAHAGGLDSTLQNDTLALDPAAGFIFNGSSAQVTGLLLPAVVGDLTFDNANGVTLSESVRADSTLTLTDGIVTTGVNNLELGPDGISSRTSGHVNGFLMKTMATGADSKTFEIGDATVYTPVDVTGAAYGGPFSILASTAPGDHPNIGTSGLDAGRSVNRSWTLTGTPTGSSDITFNFDAGDLDGLAETAYLQVGKYNGGWTLPSVGTRTATSTQATGVASLSSFILAMFPPSTILSNGTGGGDWAVGSTWQGGVSPTSGDSAVILGGDSVFVQGGGVDAFGLMVQGGGILALTDTVNAVRSTVSGLVVSHEGGSFDIDSGAVIGSGGVYQHDQNGGSMPVATWDTGSTALFTGVTSQAPGDRNQPYYNIVWDCPGQTSNLNMGFNNVTIGGDITVVNTGASNRWYLCGPSTDSTAIVTIMGDVFVQGGQFSTNGTGNSGTTIEIHHYGNIVVTGGMIAISRGSQGGTGTSMWYLYEGDFSISDAATRNSNSAGARWVFTKAGTQTLSLTNVTFESGGMPIIVETGTTLNAGTGQIMGSGIFTLEEDATLICANPGGLDSLLQNTGTIWLDTMASYVFNGVSAQATGILLPAMVDDLHFDNASGVTMSGSVVVNGTLHLTSGVVSTGANFIEVASAGSTERTSGHVDGVLRKYLGPGADSETFEVGDASVYAPVDVTGASYGTEFPLGVSTTPGDHASIGSSTLDDAKSVNRTWTFAGTATGSSDITFNFDASDVDGGANTDNFQVGQYDGTWTMPTVGTKTSTSTQALGVTGFSDFQVAEGDSVFLAEYRSFTPTEIALDIDNKGKTGKYVKLKPVRVDFSVYFVVNQTDVTGMYLQISKALDTAYAYYSVPPATFESPDGKLKKWNLTFSDTLQPGDTVTVHGYGNKGKPQKVSKYYWTRGGIIVGDKLKGGTFLVNQPKLPMPNRINVLYDAFMKGGFAATNGLVVGVPRPDSVKKYGWLQVPKYNYAWKTLNRKGILHTGQPRGLDNWIKNNKPLVKLQKKLEPHKYNNALLAEMVALKVNIVASMLGITPVGFGELYFDGDSIMASPWKGYTVVEIAAAADTLMMGGYDSTGSRVFADSATFADLYDAVMRINAAFEGPMDTTDGGFSASLELTGTRSILEVAHTLRPNPTAIPATIVPRVVASYMEEPEEYTLYQNYPNPFNPTTTIEFDLPQAAYVTLKIYNLLGQEVATLFDREELSDGLQDVEFDATNLPSGVYIYRLIADGIADEDDEIAAQSFVSVKKMMFIK